jgi:uncharacterized protein DUF1844
MAEEEQESGRGFRVQDRRRFSPETGEARVEEAEQSSVGTAKEKQTAQPEFSTQAEREARNHVPEPISFSGFLLGLTTQALMFMGEVPPPPGQTKHVELEAARQTIDLLAMLQQKTKGNLDAAEESMLEKALFDLRIRYVEIAKKNSPSSSEK